MIPADFNTQSFIDFVEKLGARGYMSGCWYDSEFGWTISGITGGDSNCPHPKYYDPIDGHGFTFLDVDEIEFKEGEPSQEEFQNRVAHILLEVEGKSRRDEHFRGLLK